MSHEGGDLKQGDTLTGANDDQGDHPRAALSWADARWLCVLFGDVAGSTQLYERLGDREALRAIERCLNRLQRAAEAYAGRVIKTIGDELMLVFDDASNALLAACEMQQRIEQLPPLSGQKLAVRIGFHHGPAIEENGDVFGDTVNVAARVVALAKAGQILTTAATLASLPAWQRSGTREVDRFAIKGKSEDVVVHEVLWQNDAELTMKADNILPVTPVARLSLWHRHIERVIDDQRPMLTLGRDPASDIVIDDPRASRSHGRIERRREKFVLVDHSTNGTWVHFAGEDGFLLKREETLLRGEGRLAFGHTGDDGDSVEFRVFMG